MIRGLAYVILLALFAIVVTQNVKFTQIPLDGLLEEFKWISKDVALSRTEHNVYITTNGGQHWVGLNDKLCGSSSCVTELYVNTKNTDVVFLVGRDASENWLVTGLNQKNPQYNKVAINTDKKQKVFNVHWHPTLPTHALALLEKKNSNGYDMYLTKDGGKTWGGGPVRSQIIDASFGSPDSAEYDASKVYGIRIFQAERFFFVFDMNQLSSNDIDTVQNAQQFKFLSNFLFVATAISTSGKKSLYVSTDNANTFREIKFSTETTTGKPGAFTILDASEGSVFLNIFKHVRGTEPYGDLFLSDATGSKYSLSLAGNRRKGQACDFHKIASLEGVYIANKISEKSRQNPKCQKCSEDECETYCKFMSVITFDKGGKWDLIGGPTKDSAGHAIKCSYPLKDNKCPLQIHGFISSHSSRINSRKDAVGLVLATGNIGTYLSTNEANVNTYFSRDGGLTWSEIARGSHTYEMTNHGGLIIMAQNKEPIDSISYSWNQGISFEKANFTDSKNKLLITKIIHPTDPLARSMIMQGTRNDHTVLLHVDFSNIHKEECKGLTNPNDPTSDYEIFKPHSYDSNQCLLGRIVEYTRRKADRSCFNPVEAQSHPNKVQNCLCTYSDYTCDLYYERDFSDKDGSKLVCKVVPGQEHNVKRIPEHCRNGYYNETQGYLKVAGDSCTGGIKLDPILKKCPSSISFFGVVLIIFFLFVLLSFTSIYLYKNTNFLKNIVNGPIANGGFVSYNPVNQNEEFGLSDHEEGSEPDEIEESSFSNFKRGEGNDDANDFKVTNLEEPVEPVTLHAESNAFNPRAKKQ